MVKKKKKLHKKEQQNKSLKDNEISQKVIMSPKEQRRKARIEEQESIVAKKSKKKSNKKGSNNVLEKAKDRKILIPTSFIILVIAVYCLYKVITLVQNPTDTFSVEQGKIYQEEAVTGYIIREETVVKGSNYKNGIVRIKAEGERVAKNEAIFRYYSSGEEKLEKKIAELDVKIDEAMAGANDVLPGDVRTIEKQIEEKVTLLVDANNLQTIRETKKDISNNIIKKAKIAGEYSPSGSYLNKLINERQKYENQLNSGAEYLNAPISGVVSYKVDGYEEILAPNEFSNLTNETLNKLDIKTGQIVADSEESGKIINNFKCYIACSVKSEQAENAKIGDKLKIRLPNNTEVTSSIEYISQEEEGTLLVLKLTEQVQELVSYRKISFDIIWWSYSGKKVPNAVIGTEEKNGKTISYVIRTRAGYQDKIWIKILKDNSKYSIVDNYTNAELQELGYGTEEIQGRKTLTLYDEILKNPSQ